MDQSSLPWTVLQNEKAKNQTQRLDNCISSSSSTPHSPNFEKNMKKNEDRLMNSLRPKSTWIMNKKNELTYSRLSLGVSKGTCRGRTTPPTPKEPNQGAAQSRPAGDNHNSWNPKFDSTLAQPHHRAKNRIKDHIAHTYRRPLEFLLHDLQHAPICQWNTCQRQQCQGENGMRRITIPRYEGSERRFTLDGGVGSMG